MKLSERLINWQLSETDRWSQSGHSYGQSVSEIPYPVTNL
ncbi:unnamed protein product [marine sediment metagenome]|jgi:hypothetical protein|uniref:Uncharacterized protein n=1 Tax=marine sediment metagenome TaxID=412755 RepID=X0YNP6_9ZZZZ